MRKALLVLQKLKREAISDPDLPVTLLSTSSPGRPSLFFRQSGPTSFHGVLGALSLFLWANSKEEDKDSDDEEEAVKSASGSILLPVSQLNELLPSATWMVRAVTPFTQHCMAQLSLTWGPAARLVRHTW